MKKERFEESRQLIREHLVTLHDDGDSDSLFVRASEMFNHREEIQNKIDRYQEAVDAMLPPCHNYKS
jgi:hypothetical protein